jgi:predicted nucleic acid-binding protein
VLFWDASALVKAYSVEQGTPCVLGAFKVTRERGSLTEFVALEVFTVLSKHWRVSRLTKSQYTAAVAEFTADYQSFYNLEVQEPIRRSAFDLAQTYRATTLGAMDLLHLASALYAQTSRRHEPVVFATSDGPLQSAAAAEGLRTFNPETDPLSKLLRLLSR